jgi:hypothetical protein
MLGTGPHCEKLPLVEHIRLASGPPADADVLAVVA